MKKSVKVALLLTIIAFSFTALAAGSYHNQSIVANENHTAKTEDKPEKITTYENNLKVPEVVGAQENKKEDKKEDGKEKTTEEVTTVQNNKETERRASNDTTNRGTSRLSDEVYWLARIIHAEAEAEPYLGKAAVGNVILNRVKVSKFPNTIYGVIFDVQDGYTQFSPVLDGRIHNSPSSESIKAAKDVLDGYQPVGSALYFLNPKKSENFWIPANRNYMTTIGKHDFYH
ncbi:MAG: cell wall hydrolase [Firmicutes bacterium]|nr:cell wall hydrolase [Bacillota bacterium]